MLLQFINHLKILIFGMKLFVRLRLGMYMDFIFNEFINYLPIQLKMYASY